MYQPYPGGARMPEAQRPPAPAKVFAFAVRLVGLAAVAFLWRGTSSAFLKATPS